MNRSYANKSHYLFTVKSEKHTPSIFADSLKIPPTSFFSFFHNFDKFPWLFRSSHRYHGFSYLACVFHSFRQRPSFWRALVADLFSLKVDIPSVSSDEGLTLVTSALANSLRWPIYVINSADNTKLSCYTLPPTQHHSFFRNFSL